MPASAPWVLGGNFHDFVDPSKTIRISTHVDAHCRHFRDWIFDLELIDLGFSGPTFTWWCGDLSNSVRATRLERILCAPSWWLLFPSADVRHLQKVYSDHCPVLLSLKSNVENRARLLFVFRLLGRNTQAMWGWFVQTGNLVFLSGLLSLVWRTS